MDIQQSDVGSMFKSGFDRSTRVSGFSGYLEAVPVKGGADARSVRWVIVRDDYADRLFLFYGTTTSTSVP
jgi:hypothetical protein